MKPTDPSDSHLEDRALEFRLLKSAGVVALATSAAVFYPWEWILLLFTAGYLAYKFQYYTRRVGVYTDRDRSIQTDFLEEPLERQSFRTETLELALFGFLGVLLFTFITTILLFPSVWQQGGFLSLPTVNLSGYATRFQEPGPLLTWGHVIDTLAYTTVVVPLVALSYIGIEFRKRLLMGIDSDHAAIRATVWDGLVGVPLAALWMLVLNARPIYAVWGRLGEVPGTVLGLTPNRQEGFAVVFGGLFEPLVVASIVIVPFVVGAYITLQHWKYEDQTVPEILGYRGLAPPDRQLHNANVVVPVVAFLLYLEIVMQSLPRIPFDETRLIIAVVVSVLVGANILGQTQTTLRKFSLTEEFAQNVDTVVIGLIAGMFALVLLVPVLSATVSLAVLAFVYPILAIPTTYGCNWLVGKRVTDFITDYGDRVEKDSRAHDQKTVDRLFVYSDARDNTLRAAAVEAIATSLQVSTYRKDDALEVFEEALRSSDEELIQSGLKGIGTCLDYDQSAEIYEWLVDVDAADAINGCLDSEDGHTQRLAAETVARMYTIELTANDSIAPDRMADEHVSQMVAIVENNPQETPLASAVTEYFATMWYLYARQRDAESGPDEDAGRKLLGQIIQIAAHGDETARLKAAFAVTSKRAVADEDTLEAAFDHLDSTHEEIRYLSTHVIRSSMDEHAPEIETEQLTELLEDPSKSVRWMTAETLLTLLSFNPERGVGLRDRLLLHLEENGSNPGRTERSVLESLSRLEAKQLAFHPTAVSTISAFVEKRNSTVSVPAAQLLASFVQSWPNIAQQEPVKQAVEFGLTHRDENVRLACLEIVVSTVENSLKDGRQFVEGLGANLDADGRRGAMAAVVLMALADVYPEVGLDIIPELLKGLRNSTELDTTLGSIADGFETQASTVSEVAVEILAEATVFDPSRGKGVIEALVELAPSAEKEILGKIMGTLATLSDELPEESQVALKAAAIGLEEQRVSIRRDATKILANVAAYHPDAVEPFTDRLVVASEDGSPRVRAPALVALRNVCATRPQTVEGDIHRIVGRLDDDSAIVRTQAGRLIAAVAERNPEIIDPAAETVDRLRNLQRDPAVDLDSGRLQDAVVAIQTARSTGAQTSQRREEIWSPEGSDEMGVSGATKEFEPVGDEFESEFDSFDDEFGETNERSQPENIASDESEGTATVEDNFSIDGDASVGGSTDHDGDLTTNETGELDGDTTLESTDAGELDGDTTLESTDAGELDGDTTLESTGLDESEADETEDDDPDEDETENDRDPEAEAEADDDSSGDTDTESPSDTGAEDDAEGDSVAETDETETESESEHEATDSVEQDATDESTDEANDAESSSESDGQTGTEDEQNPDEEPTDETEPESEDESESSDETDDSESESESSDETDNSKDSS